MPETFQLDVLTPTESLNFEQVAYLRAPSVMGKFGIMANHADAVFALEAGELKVTSEGKDNFFACGDGYANIKNGNVQLLIETILPSGSIDVQRAEAAEERAEGHLANPDSDHNRAERAMLRAKIRLAVALKK